ncbi:hypothetical protein [uncultured Hyphomicrobium sp.]|uniref:hypothetical protein n=1 Tax=uncultured Hyphomicrobium sp. TaxID=194373 RepID=UPI0025EA93A4|nr:hypothetical protein [uncultured Hyphomicrobium sp.]
MRKLLAGLAGALAIALFAPALQAAPLGAAGNASGAQVSSEIIQVHGLHSACRRDRFGWHRSHIWGRERCVPHWLRHHHHGKKYWKKRR